MSQCATRAVEGEPVAVIQRRVLYINVGVPRIWRFHYRQRRRVVPHLIKAANIASHDTNDLFSFRIFFFRFLHNMLLLKHILRTCVTHASNFYNETILCQDSEPHRQTRADL